MPNYYASYEHGRPVFITDLLEHSRICIKYLEDTTSDPPPPLSPGLRAWMIKHFKDIKEKEEVLLQKSIDDYNSE